MVASRIDFLDLATRFGLEWNASDTSWRCGKDNTIAHTGLMVKKDNGHFTNFIASLSSSEDANSMANILQSVEACRPCDPDGCNHELVVVDQTPTKTTFRRNCPAKVPASPIVSTDKAIAGVQGIKAAGGKHGIDHLHHYIAFGAKMAEFGLPNNHVAAGVDFLHRISMRALDQPTKDRCIDNVLRYITTWNDGRPAGERLTAPELLGFQTYIRSSLSYTGSIWCVGDLYGFTSTTACESAWATYRACVANGLVETNPTKVVCNTFLALTPTGQPSKEADYWTICARLQESSDRAPLTSPERARREAEGLMLYFRQKTRAEDEMQYILKVKPDEPMCTLYFVKSGTKTIIAAGVGATTHNFAARDDLDRARKDVHGSFNFDECVNLLIPSTLPLMEGYYTVDVATGVCLGMPPCRDYLHRGSCTHKCKHGWGALVTHADVAEQRKREIWFFNFLQNRERSSLASQRNEVLYQGTEPAVIQALKNGDKSFHRSSVQQEQNGPEVRLFLRVDSVFDLMQRVTLTQFEPHLHGKDGLPASLHSDCQVVTVIHGGESMAYFRKRGLFDANDQLVQGRYLGVHDLIVGLGLTLDDMNADTASDPIVLEVFQAQAGRRENVSARKRLLDTVRVPGLKSKPVGGGNINIPILISPMTYETRNNPGREHRRKVKSSVENADAARPGNLKVNVAGRSVQHQYKPLATAKRKKSFNPHDVATVRLQRVSAHPTGASAEAGTESNDDVRLSSGNDSNDDVRLSSGSGN